MPGAYLAANLIHDGMTITPSSEDENYPAANLYDRQAAKVFRSTSASSLSILLDFLVSVQADTLAIVNHNFTAGATLSLKADNSNPPTTVIISPTYRKHDIWKSFTLTSARYWQIEIGDGNSDALQIGQLIIGTRIALPRARRIGEGFEPARERSNIAGETYAGTKWAYYLFDRLELNPSFRVASEEELQILEEMDAALYGDIYPFVYIPDVTRPDCYYMRKEQGFKPAELNRIGPGNIAYDYRMQLVEESRGLEILE